MLFQFFRSLDKKPHFYGSGIVFVIALLFFVFALVNTPSTPVPSQLPSSQKIQTILAKNRISPVFHDRTIQAGLYFVHHQRGEKLTGLNETLGSGACAMDYDQDGWIDLFLVNGVGQTYFYGQRQWWQQQTSHALYRNTGNAKFENVTKDARLTDPSWGMGCVAGDLDNDGDPDLFITNFGANTLYRNNGDGTFEDISKHAGFAGNRWSTSATLADYDNDGLLDIYVVNYIRYQKGGNTLEEDSGFQIKSPPSFSAKLYDSEGNRLYRNLGNLQFEDVTRDAGVIDSSGRGLAAIWMDLDGNQYLDLVVANDENSPNAIFLNAGDGTFQEAGSYFRLNIPHSSTGLATGDLDNDEDLDLVVGSGSGYPMHLFINQRSPVSFQSDFYFSGVPLHDQARERGVGDETSISLANRGIGMFDFNNDGWLDLFVVNGWNIPDLDNPASAQGQRKLLWVNQGNGILHGVENLESLRDNLSARSAVFADFDNDGDMDIYVTHNNDLGQLLMNETKPQHWLGIQLEGSISNRDAIGAKVWLGTSNKRQFQTVRRGEGYLSNNDPRIHFGLGEAAHVKQISVQWPDGTQTNYPNVPVDHYITILQDQPQIRMVQTTSSFHEAQTSLKLQLGSEKAENRAEYLRWLVENNDMDEQLRELKIAVHDPDAGVRKTAIEMAGNMEWHQGISILIPALDDLEAPNRIAALQALQQYEQDILVRWLLRSFHDPSPQVRCTVAEVFASFFHEEEAVIHRKYAAIPELIRLLDDKNPKVRQCAIRALGHSENFRGVGPLLHLLDDEVAEVRLEAIRSLGLIREQRVAPALHRIFKNPDQSPQVKAQVLIALKRLNDPNWLTLFKNLLPPLSTTDPDFEKVYMALEILHAIQEDYQDGVVISHQRLHEVVLAWLGSPDNLLRSNVPQKITLSILEILKKLRSSDLFTVTEQLTNHQDAVVRQNTYQMLMQLDIHDFIANLSVPLLLKQLEDSATRLLAIKALAHYATEDVVQKALLRIIEDDQQDINSRLAAFDSLGSGASHRVLSDYLYRDSHELLRAASLKYWGNQLSTAMPKSYTPYPLIHSIQDPSMFVRQIAVEILLKQKDAWAKQILDNIILDANQPLDIRAQVLQGFPIHQDKVHLEMLLRLARWRHDPIYKNAISGLGQFDDPRAEQFLWKLLKNKKEMTEVRWEAASALQHRSPQAILQYVRSKDSL